MRIGFDLNTGNQIEELALPEKTSFLFAPQQLILAGQSALSFNWEDQQLVSVSLQLEVSPKDLRRLAKADVAGVSNVPEVEENLFLQVELEATPNLFKEHEQAIAQADDAEALLYLEKDAFPIFLNLSHYQVRRILQVTQSIEEVQ